MWDGTAKVSSIRPDGDHHTEVVFSNGNIRRYRNENVDIRAASPERIPHGARVVVEGEEWARVETITRFGDQTRISRRRDGELRHSLRASEAVEVIDNAATRVGAKETLAYWRRLAHELGGSIAHSFSSLGFVHPDSVLAAYLSAAHPALDDQLIPAIYPFRSNLSQREAVDTALTNRISIIEGPPGTGKTQTILNIVASVVAARDKRVGVVSFTNSAVDNVAEKLNESGVGFIAARLGNKAIREAFLLGQTRRNAEVAEMLASPPLPAGPTRARLARLSQRLRDAQERERIRAAKRVELDAYRLEFSHFEHSESNRTLPDLQRVPLLRKSPARILDYLAETEIQAMPNGFVDRVRRYFRYGSTKDLDPTDVGVTLRLQEQYYRRTIAALEQEITELDAKLARDEPEKLAAQHAAASLATLDGALRDRYSDFDRKTYGDRAWATDRDFARDYPVVLSSCHALANSLPRGELLDLLVIDESSQVDLLTAAVALACARSVVVVGDERQLAPITDKASEGSVAPDPAFDYRAHNLMSSMRAAFAGSEGVPSTVLVEHYRCAPAIIGYCNRAFYQGQLVTYTVPDPSTPAMTVRRTAQGGHMRQGRGTSNEREVDVIREEVLPSLPCPPGASIGLITPYRLQAQKLSSLADSAGMVDLTGASDTVHRYQGRERDVVIMSTVLDDTRVGHFARRFVDEPRLVNVAVSRAKQLFVLVTHHSLHPGTRHLAELIDYIRYQTPVDALQESDVLSVFDLLYRDYSPRLDALAARVGAHSRYRSENIMSAVLETILSEERFNGLSVRREYRLSHLFRDVARFSPEQRRFISTTTAVDFLIHTTVGLRPVLGIEVDGWKFHENSPEQSARDAVKNSIFDAASLPLCRLTTTGSDEEAKIRMALESALTRLYSGGRMADVTTDRVPQGPGSR